jgi:cephalosporin hydroxylase
MSAWDHLRPMRRDYRRRLRWSLRRWQVYLLDEILNPKRAHWMGVPALKNPLDAWIYQEIIWETKPEVIVELGNAFGGGTLFLAHMLDQLGAGEVVAVDWSHEAFEAAHPRITKVTGDTRSPETIAQVRELCSGKRTMLIHDADHTYDAVTTDLRNYSSLVSPGCYFIVEDGIGDLLRIRRFASLERRAMAAAEDFAASSPSFEIDESRERYVATYNPRGFLKRLRLD